MAKITVICASPRKGNTEAVAMKIAEAAKANGNEIETFRLNDLKNVRGCQACMACKKMGKCVQKDDISTVLESIRNADGVVLAFPDYFGQPCAQFRVLQDRMYSFLGADFVPNIAAGKKVATVVSCASPAEAAQPLADSIDDMMVKEMKCVSLGKIVIGKAGAPNVASADADIMAQAEAIGKKF